MKNRFFILLFVLLLCVDTNALAADTVSLQFTYPMIETARVYALPNGYYEAIYYTPDTSEFWLNQGRNDVSECVIEVFDSLGQSIWKFRLLNTEIFQDDADAFFYQNEVRSDQIVFEYYWDHSLERYVSKNWSFDGERLFTSLDPIHQAEESFRYITSQYPYTLESWPFGEAYDKPAKLTYVPDGTWVELPFTYGIYSSFVSAEHGYYMLYEANGTIDGDEGALYWLTYSPDTQSLTCAKTNLTSCSGELITVDDTIVFLGNDDRQTCVFYTAPLNGAEGDFVTFTKAGEFPVTEYEVISSLVPTSQGLLCLKNRVIDMNLPTERYESELCTVSLEGNLVSVQKWDSDVSFLSTAGPLQFVCRNGAGGTQIVRLSDEDIASFFTSFDPAQ